MEVVDLPRPCLLAIQTGANQVRYASLKGIMQAKKKPVDEKTPDDYGVDVAPRLQVLKTTEPPIRQAGVKVASVADLLAKLKNEAGVL